MSKIVLIACGRRKQSYRSKAKDLYIGPLFKESLRYAQSNLAQVYILSAKHGLLGLNDEIDPYDQTLKNMSAAEVKAWAIKVKDQLTKVGVDFKNDQVEFLAGSKYRKWLISYFNIKNVSIPLEGLRIGEQLKWLKTH